MRTHAFQTQIYFEDTDAAGVVYHAAYLRFMERGRTQWLQANGSSLAQLTQMGVVLVVRKLTVDYLAGAGLEDCIEIQTEYLGRRRAQVEFNQTVLHHAQIKGDPNTTKTDSKILCRGHVCCVAKAVLENKPVGLPAELRKLLDNT